MASLSSLDLASRKIPMSDEKPKRKNWVKKPDAEPKGKLFKKTDEDGPEAVIKDDSKSGLRKRRSPLYSKD